MVRHLILNIWILAACCSAAKAAAPSVDRLLDLLGATMDRCHASYVCVEEGTKVRSIRKAPSPPYRLGEHKMHYRREYRWDGQRFLQRVHRWGDNVREPWPRSVPKENAEYMVYLSDLDRVVKYSFYLGDKPEDRRLSYWSRPFSGESLRHLTANNTVLINRLDKELRDCPSVRVCPRTEKINGADCYVIEGHTSQARYTVWIDPTHGYNIAKYVRESGMARTVCSNVAFRQIDGVWVPVESVTEMKSLPARTRFDDYAHEHVKVTEFKIDPNHEALKSFAVDEEIPTGARVLWSLPNGRVITDGYVWKNGGPVADVDEKTMSQLDKIATILKRNGLMPSIHDQTRPVAEGR